MVLAVVMIFGSMSVMASAQVLEKAANRLELCTVETEYGENSLSGEIEVFQMKDTGKYWLSVGHLGIGGDIVQLNFDPVYELFIPLGDTIDEAIETMKDMKAFYSKPRLTKMAVCQVVRAEDLQRLIIGEDLISVVERVALVEEA